MELLDRGVPVLAEPRRPKQVVPQRVGAVDVDQVERLDDVAERLRDLRWSIVRYPWTKSCFGTVVARRTSSKRGPEHAVEAKDVLREQVTDLRPEALDQVLALPRIGESAQVVDERVDPDVRDLVRRPRKRHPPGLAGAADAEVLQAALDEASRLVGAELRQHEVGPLVIELEQPVLVGGEAEEVVLLFDPLGLDAVLRALAVDELGLRLERLAADAVEALVRVLVDVAVVVDPLEEVLDERLVALVARADEEVGVRIQTVQEARASARRSGRRTPLAEPLLLGDARDLGGVLVGAGEEERLVAALPAMTHEDVRRDRRVRMTDVRRRVDVVDRCRQVEAHGDQ